MSLAISPSVASFFHEALAEAMTDRRVRASDAATGYLVELLVAFAHPDPRIAEALQRPLAFVLDDALHAQGAERFDRLRALGDGVLYLAGFFGDHVETRGVDPGYVAGIGAAAYGSAASMRAAISFCRSSRPSSWRGSKRAWNNSTVSAAMGACFTSVAHI